MKTSTDHKMSVVLFRTKIDIRLAREKFKRTFRRMTCDNPSKTLFRHVLRLSVPYGLTEEQKYEYIRANRDLYSRRVNMTVPQLEDFYNQYIRKKKSFYLPPTKAARFPETAIGILDAICFGKLDDFAGSCGMSEAIEFIKKKDVQKIGDILNVVDVKSYPVGSIERNTHIILSGLVYHEIPKFYKRRLEPRHYTPIGLINALLAYRMPPESVFRGNNMVNRRNTALWRLHNEKEVASLAHYLKGYQKGSVIFQKITPVPLETIIYGDALGSVHLPSDSYGRKLLRHFYSNGIFKEMRGKTF